MLPIAPTSWDRWVFEPAPLRRDLQSPPDPEVKKKIAKTRGGKGFGGPYRAYIRHKTLGCRGRPVLKGMGARYKEDLRTGAVDEGYLRDLGRAATISGRLRSMKAGESSFGATGRAEQRKRRRLMHDALVHAAQGEDNEQAALALSERLIDLGGDVQAGVTAARAAMRRRTLEMQRAKQDGEKALEAFAAGPGARALAELQRALPQLAETTGLIPIPSPSGIAFEVCPSIRDVVVDAASWAYKSKGCNASGAMRAHWAETHMTLPEIVTKTAAPEPEGTNECLSAGRCLCCPEGKLLRAFRNSCLKAMKEAFPPGTPQRKRLQDGFVVLRLTGKPEDADLDAFIDMDEPVADTWLHIGIQYLSPFRPTFMEVELASGVRAEDPEGRRLWVQADPPDVRPM